MEIAVTEVERGRMVTLSPFPESRATSVSTASTDAISIRARCTRKG
jgi:hypothetical protein